MEGGVIIFTPETCSGVLNAGLACLGVIIGVGSLWGGGYLIGSR